MAETLLSDLLTFHQSRSVIISALDENANFRVTVVYTSTIPELFCKGIPVRKLRSNSSSGWFKLSFELSTTSVCSVSGPHEGDGSFYYMS